MAARASQKNGICIPANLRGPPLCSNWQMSDAVSHVHGGVEQSASPHVPVFNCWFFNQHIDLPACRACSPRVQICHRKLEKSAYWLERIFYCAAGGIKITHIDTLLLSLASADIIEVKCVHWDDQWNIKRSGAEHANAGTPNYQKDENWRGCIDTTKAKREKEMRIFTQHNVPIGRRG